MKELWITKTLKFAGESQNQTYIEMDTILASSTGKEIIDIQFVDVTITGKIYIGDASLTLTRVRLIDVVMQQEYQRHLVSQKIEYNVEGSIIFGSIFMTKPPTTMSVNSSHTVYENCQLASLSLIDSAMTDSLVNLTAVRIQFRMEKTNVTASKNSNFKYVGIYILTGFTFNDVNSTSDSSSSSKTQTSSSGSRRKRRSVTDMYTYNGNIGNVNTQHIVSDANKHSRTKRSTSSTKVVQNEEEEQTEIVISNSVFTNLYQADLTGQASITIITQDRYTLSISEVTFQENERAINVEILNGQIGSILISKCRFTKNRSLGPGGAVHIYQESGQLSLQIIRCKFYHNIALGVATGALYNTGKAGKDANVAVDTNIQLSKITGSGGAIAINLAGTYLTAQCLATITHCTFVNNTAESYGGSIYITSGVTARLIKNNFTNVNHINHTRPIIGDILESRGNLYLINNTFNVRTAENEISILSYRAVKDGSFLQTRNLMFLCPNGFKAKPIYSAIKTKSTRIPIETLLLFCRSCSEGEYTLDAAQMSVDQTKDPVIQDLTNTTCTTCPYGAKCNKDIKSKANFWGDVHNGKVTMFPCAEGYCCQQEVCPSFNTCADNREGPLCGRCKQNFSESLFSSECIANTECTYATWFWVVIALYGLLYVLFFVFEEECQVIVKSFANWLSSLVAKYTCMKTKISDKGSGDISGVESEIKNDNNIDSQDVFAKGRRLDDDGDHQEEEGAYLQIFMYYIQVPALLKITILYENNRQPVTSILEDYIKNVFSFNTFGLSFNNCLFPGVTSVIKTTLTSGYIIYLFLLWMGMFAVATFVMALRRGRPFRIRLPTNIAVSARFWMALVSLMLYTYQYFAENSFTLLKCVNIPSQVKSVLFIDANLQCYSIWQYGVFLFAFVYVFPFFTVLTFAPSLLNKRVISVKTFILSMLFPLISSPFLIYLFHSNKGLTSNNAEDHKVGGSVDMIVKLVSEPYIQTLGGGLCWEGMLALRRLILVLLSTLITNHPVFRHLTLAITCYCSLIVHMKLKPFAKQSCNYLETCSLTVLLAISVMNLLKASYFTMGEVPNGSADTIFQVYDWLEAVFLGIIPIIIVGFVILAILGRLFGLIISKCCGSMLMTKGHPSHIKNIDMASYHNQYYFQNADLQEERRPGSNLHERKSHSNHQNASFSNGVQYDFYNSKGHSQERYSYLHSNLPEGKRSPQDQRINSEFQNLPTSRESYRTHQPNMSSPGQRSYTDQRSYTGYDHRSSGGHKSSKTYQSSRPSGEYDDPLEGSHYGDYSYYSPPVSQSSGPYGRYRENKYRSTRPSRYYR